jgi:hypothetical protein
MLARLLGAELFQVKLLQTAEESMKFVRLQFVRILFDQKQFESLGIPTQSYSMCFCVNYSFDKYQSPGDTVFTICHYPQSDKLESDNLYSDKLANEWFFVFWQYIYT